MNTMQKVFLIRKELERMEANTPKDGWLCWKCDKPNRYTDTTTQVEKDETCVHVCRYCQAYEKPF